MSSTSVAVEAEPGVAARGHPRLVERFVYDDAVVRKFVIATMVWGVVATLAGVLHEAQLSGDWQRLKGCRQCGYAFFDFSKNRSATWCSMSICGNRSKNRAYYRRQHPLS